MTVIIEFPSLSDWFGDLEMLHILRGRETKQAGTSPEF